MSDKVIDLKQATLGLLAQRLSELTQAIVTSNNRYIALNNRVDEGFNDMRRLITDTEKRLGERINAAHSEVISEANKMITLQDQMWQFMLNHSDKPDGE